MAKPEAKFTAEMRDSFKHFDCAFYHRIEDDAFNALTQHTRKKPFDALWWWYELQHDLTKVVAAEYKAVTGVSRWYLRELKPHQIEGLTNAERNGATSYLIVNFRQIPGAGKNNNRVMFLTLADVLSMIADGKKSLTVEDFDKCYTLDFEGEELQRVKLDKGYGWDVKSLC